MDIFGELQNFSDQIAVITEQGTSVSYHDLANDSDQLSDQIGDRCLIFIVCRNAYASLVGYVSALRHHIVPVLINEGIDEALFDQLVKSYHPRFVFQPVDNKLMVGRVKYEWQGYELVETEETIDYALGEELALLLTTSGSTGSPKLVRQSYKNILSNAKSIVMYLNLTSADRAITTLPMHYTYGLSIINSHLLCGGCMILNQYTLMERGFWQLLKEQKATNFGGVPYTYEMLYKLHFDRMQLPSLRLITQAGGKLSKSLSAYFAKCCNEKDIQFFVMYGQTEATARMAYLPAEKAIEKAGSMGIAIPGGTFELLDAQDHIITEAHVTGELIYKGENVTLGYAKDRFELAKADENHGILHTGDMAQRDEEGFYYIVGRKKRFLKLYGNRVNLDELENILKEQRYECVCHGEDDHLIIYTVEDDEKEIRQFVIAHTSIIPGSFEVKKVSCIPRNAAGKVLYSEL